MDPRYLETLVNEDGHTVLGRRLHPFCLYDIVLLEVDNNAIWADSERITWADLITAVLICNAEPGKWLSPTRGRRWYVRLWRFLWAIWVQRHYDINVEATKFVAYVKDYYTKPSVWKSDDGKPAKAPWVLSLAVILEDHSNMSHDQIMRAPAGQMMWMHAAIAELHYGLDIVGEEDYEGMKALGLIK